ncbi:MAG TPA: response regulator [Bryobacteraceae bacterium]|nr:response regulator [Bryobacteraceae bacterium]
MSEQEGLPADRVNCLFEDREGLLWIGFADLGMARWRGRDEWESYTRADGLASNAVTAVRTTADGMLWVGSRSGLIRLDRKSGRAREISRGEVRSLAATPDGMIWSASSTDGLIRVDPKTLHVERIGSASGLSARKILSLWVDPGGSLWLACREGVYHSLPNAPRPTFEPVAIQILERGEEIYAVRTDTGGRLWLAGNRGLVIRDGGAWTRVGTNEGLRSRGLVFLTLGKDGSAWVGYDRHMGVSRINREPGHTRIRDFDQDGILRSNDVCFLETGERGWIWVGTDNGLDVYNGRNWRHFSSHDGLIWHDVVLNAFYQDADGSVWIGTNLGLSHYTPRESVFDVPAPVAALTNVSFGGEAAGLQTAQIKVPYKRRSAKISFTTLSFSRQHVTRFRYRLKGLDDTWVETRDREAVFPNLAPANYEFEVQAGADGRWNPLGASFSFHLEAPWWETNWFNGGLVLFLALTGGNIYLRRMKRGLVQRKELETAVAERTFELEMEKNRTEREKQIVEEHQREIENLLAKAQEASRLKGEFLANVSHEIRTPMNGMLGMTSLALQTPLTEDQRDYLETAKASGESLLCLLNDILDFSKIEANRLELEAVPFSLAASLEESVRSLAFQAQQRGLALDAIRNPGVPDIVIGDPGRLRQVLLNLLSNAIKFTNQGWVRLSVHTDHWDGPEAVLKFQVKDTGCGIPQDKQAVIFDAFRQADGSTTRKHGGTGLGLAICARLVGMMGGRIWVNSDGVNGSEFLFTAKFAVGASLPGNPPPAHQIGKLAAAVDKGGTRVLRVLVAEDNLVNQKLVVRLLEKQGHTVEVAANGAQALHMTSRMRYDLVLMDVQMPEVDGIETTRRIREREERTGDHLPILMLTANAMVGDREKCLQAGADGYLPKPVSTELRMSAIEKLA